MVIALLICVALLALAWALWADTFNGTYLQGIAIAVAGDWGGYNLHLYVNNVPFTFSTVIGGLTEASFPGYAAQALSAGSVGATVGQTVPISVPSVTFTRSTTGTAQIAYGYYVTDGAGNLVGGGQFPSPGPYTFQFAGDNLSIPITENLIAA